MYYPFQSQGEWSLAKFLAENLTQTQIKRFLALPWLIWRDAEEVVQSLFGNPIFGANMMFDPILVMTALGREYSEWFPAHEAHRIQDSLPDGATITPVTRMTGGLEMHPLFISIGLKHSVDTGSMMLDPHGHLWHCFMPLVAWTADLPEQLMIACVSKSASPVTEATHKQFGDVHRQSSHTSNLTLQHIEQVTWNVHPWDNLNSFQRQAKMLQLNGICLPFWRNWLFVNPSTFLLPEILHTCHKFFFDHVLPWCKVLLGDELNVRFKCHHKHIAVRHFVSSISHVKQMTGREHCDIQCTIIPMIAGCVPPWFLHAVCTLISFIYQAQSPVHTDSSVEAMELSLHEFHTHKDAIIEARARMTKSGGVKDDFLIPKLELFHSFAEAIHNSGGLIQYTADHPFQHTNKGKDFVDQSMWQFDMYSLIHSSDIPLINTVSMEEEEITTANPMLAWMRLTCH
ncbi:hypothetical protein F5J12DRAFT_901798 [Pisolithus orientalis]|uniref:uncharacterized protein n=1 Tax=Pisolithus orientalis TaxID=936130 RepID=UPI002225B4C7|nr:uncharacterized protein F5J12DRAFT_901798 [Pisolithus orientalis]KAI6034859.1 hypothetical protein F5J12DRAFT_901798 [Pisolithus orientalis]